MAVSSVVGKLVVLVLLSAYVDTLLKVVTQMVWPFELIPKSVQSSVKGERGKKSERLIQQTIILQRID
jgi:hypothetical protein